MNEVHMTLLVNAPTWDLSEVHIELVALNGGTPPSWSFPDLSVDRNTPPKLRLIHLGEPDPKTTDPIEIRQQTIVHKLVDNGSHVWSVGGSWDGSNFVEGVLLGNLPQPTGWTACDLITWTFRVEAFAHGKAVSSWAQFDYTYDPALNQQQQSPNCTQRKFGTHGNQGGSGSSGTAGSFDPNDKLAPAGYGDAAFVQADGSLAYQIRFENLATATGPAREISVVDTLDENVDLNTFELSEIRFADQSISLPAGVQQYETNMLMKANGADIFVEVSAGLDYTKRQVSLTLRALDPNTGWFHEDPLVGLLYPNDDTGRGEGSISYLVRPKAGLPSDTVIENQASIVFDYNDPIDTPLVSNTLDAEDPVSAVKPLPPTTAETSFVVSWAGDDEAAGSGIAAYDVYASDNGGPYVLWQASTAETSAEFKGELGHTYAFYSVARDNVGHVERVPGVPDATTLVQNNQPPAAAILGPPTGVRGQSLNYHVSATDSSPADMAAGFSFRIDWGDGSPVQMLAAVAGETRKVVEHAFADTGSYVVHITASDREGAVSEAAAHQVEIKIAELQEGGRVLAVGGSRGNDAISFRLRKNENTRIIKITVFMNDKNLGSFTAPEKLAVFGQEGNDVIVAPSALRLNRPRRSFAPTAWFDGGPGNDRLTGGPMADVLLGGPGNDILDGREGADLLIGGPGADRILGGPGDNLLIAAATIFDHRASALSAIFAEWTSTRTYSQRVANISGLTAPGMDGSTFGTRHNAGNFLTLTGSSPTVEDDTARDVLTGSGNRDWFLINADGSPRDLITNLGRNDLATRLGSLPGGS